MFSEAAPRLLIVEDDMDTQANLRDILELDGYETHAVATLEQARQKDWRNFFAFVLDHRLPDGTAEDLLPDIRNPHRAPGP